MPGAELVFVPRTVHIRTFLYQVDVTASTDVPDWFGVAIPDGITDFSRPILYFHPSTAGAGYQDGPSNATYFGKKKPADQRTPKESEWLNLFYYVDLLAGQLAGAVQAGGSPNQVVVLPFMPSSAIATTGILKNHWPALLADILADVRATVTTIAQPLTVTDLVLAGFSFGTQVAHNFLEGASGAALSPVLSELWDFDGNVTAPSSHLAGQYTTVKYSEGPRPGSLALPAPRWNAYPVPAPDEIPPLPQRGDRHHLIRDFLFLHAAWRR